MSEYMVPQGFRMGGVCCGVKASQSLDMALFVSDMPCTAAGVFTKNQVVGAPVIVSRQRVPTESARAVVINSGNSNACTGERGIVDAKQMTSIVAEQIQSNQETDVLVCSTGIIGHFLPMEKIGRGIREVATQLGASKDYLELAARAIMTTDTVCKICSRRFQSGDKWVTVTGVAKGAAMIAPNMATMLSVIMTDGSLSATSADRMLKAAVNQSFNNIVVEGHTSTSDTVLLLANGASDVDANDENYKSQLQQAIDEVCMELSQKIIRDAEGATHFVTVKVSGLPVEEDARKIAKAICEGPLVKTAIAGNDPNWGRIVSAAGYAGVTFREEDVSLVLNGVVLYDNGRPVEFNESAVSNSMKEGEVVIDLKFRLGPAEVTYWTCDLTEEYIRLNADYST